MQQESDVLSIASVSIASIRPEGEKDGAKYFDDFMQFHKDNPAVYRLFQQYAFEAINSGRKHYSAREVMGRVRWNREVTTQGDVFKINNNYIAYYGRLFMAANPEHAGFFLTRSLTDK